MRKICSKIAGNTERLRRVIEMSSKVTMKDIADKLGISVAAVSKGLTGKGGVSGELRSRILRTAEEMGYSIRPPKPVRSSGSDNIGIITPERFITDNAFYFKFIHGLTGALQKNGKYALFHTLTAAGEENLVIPDIFTRQRADGMIILGQVSKEYVTAVSSTNIPVVFLDFYNELTAGSCIICDSFYGSYEITNHLIACGHRDIAFVGSVYATSSIQDRYLGYVKSLMEHRLSVSSARVINDRDEEGKPIPIELPQVMPTAFVCNCDETACRLITKLHSEGIRVPEDVSVTGFDNSVFSSMANPNITTVEVNTAQMSALAVDALMERIRSPLSAAGMIQVKGRLIFRDSVRSVNH